jgi:hypothetical protein
MKLGAQSELICTNQTGCSIHDAISRGLGGKHEIQLLSSRFPLEQTDEESHHRRRHVRRS